MGEHVHPFHPSPIIVCGMTRTGTGLTTRLLQELGIYMGDETRMTKNGEPVVFKDLNRNMLDGFGCTWRNPTFLPSVFQMTHYCDWVIALYNQPSFDTVLEQTFFNGNSASIKRWGFKEPRNSLLLPFWKRIFPDATVIHVKRNAHSVARSNILHDWSRENFNPYYHNKGELKGWFGVYKALNALFNERIEETIDQFDAHYTIQYEDLTADPIGEVTKLAEFVKTPTADIERIASIIDPNHTDRWNENIRIIKKNGTDLSFMEEED